MITFTPKAAEEVKKMQEEAKAESQFLRFFIEQAGCAGNKYGMGFDDKQNGDLEFESEGVTFIIDPSSLERMQGAVVDYKNTIEQSGFQISNPQAKHTCGCGKSFN